MAELTREQIRILREIATKQDLYAAFKTALGELQ
jgi:hypothetical protein